jgi:hypothetical protein
MHCLCQLTLYGMAGAVKHSLCVVIWDDPVVCCLCPVPQWLLHTVDRSEVMCWVLQEDLTTRQKQEALYGQTAVHATFGDVELAQITLRGAS